MPEITLYFWIIKVLCTTVGETFADFLNVNLGLGLTKTTWLMGALLFDGPGIRVPFPEICPGTLLAGRRAAQHRGHPGHGQPE